jgi:hypothetical protein
MPEDYGERDEFADDEEEAGGTGRAWPDASQASTGYPLLLDAGYRPGGPARRRGLLIAAAIAVVAAAAGFGVVVIATGDVPGSPAARAAPSAGASGGGVPSSGTGNGTPLVPQASGLPSLPPGATVQLEIGGPVTHVSATSITVGSGDHGITAAVTRATTITGNVTSIGGIKVGDLVSVAITGTNGKLTADSIQDPASLPSAPSQ